jgi:hypothetical protein
MPRAKPSHPYEHIYTLPLFKAASRRLDLEIFDIDKVTG